MHSEVGPDIARYYKGAGVDAAERIRLFKLAWDATGTQFGQRMLQYERYYAGDPVRLAASYYKDSQRRAAAGPGQPRAGERISGSGKPTGLASAPRPDTPVRSRRI